MTVLAHCRSFGDAIHQRCHHLKYIHGQCKFSSQLPCFAVPNSSPSDLRHPSDGFEPQSISNSPGVVQSCTVYWSGRCHRGSATLDKRHRLGLELWHIFTNYVVRSSVGHVAQEKGSKMEGIPENLTLRESQTMKSFVLHCQPSLRASRIFDLGQADFDCSRIGQRRYVS